MKIKIKATIKVKIPNNELPQEDIKRLVYSQALQRLKNIEQVLVPKSTRWIYELKDLAYLLSMLTDEDLARLSKEINPDLPPQDHAVKVFLEDKTGKDELFG